MIDITIPVDAPMIKVNSHVFTQQKSDMEIYEMVCAIESEFTEERYRDMTKEDRHALLERLAGAVDAVLGDGATKILSGGHPVNAGRLLLWLGKIGAACADNFTEMISNE